MLGHPDRTAACLAAERIRGALANGRLDLGTGAEICLTLSAGGRGQAWAVAHQPYDADLLVVVQRHPSLCHGRTESLTISRARAAS